MKVREQQNLSTLDFDVLFSGNGIYEKYAAIKSKELGLIYLKEILKNLEENPNYLLFFQNHIKEGLSAIKNGTYREMEDRIFDIF